MRFTSSYLGLTVLPMAVELSHLKDVTCNSYLEQSPTNLCLGDFRHRGRKLGSTASSMRPPASWEGRNIMLQLPFWSPVLSGDV